MPSCQPDVPADHPVHGFRVRGHLGRHVCASCGGVVFLLGCRQGAQSGGATGSFCILRWHGGIGYEIGLFSLSFLFLSGGIICLSLPDMDLCGTAIARHVSYWAPRCVCGAFKVVALRTVLGIGWAMNLKVVMEAAAFERKEIVPFCYDDDILIPTLNLLGLGLRSSLVFA